MRLLNDLTDEQEEQFYSLSDCKSEEGEEATEMGIWRTNNFALGRTHSKCSNGIFPKLSRFNHSCVPTAEFRWNERRQMQEIRAIRHIRVGQEICLCYFTTKVLEQSKAERQEYLQTRYGFLCDCDACRLTGEDLEVDDNRRLEVRSLRADIDELLYEWVDIEEETDEDEDSGNHEDNENHINDDYDKALRFAIRRYNLMEILGFKAISLLDGLSCCVEIARDIKDTETAVKYATEGRSKAIVLYGQDSQEVLDWDSILIKCIN